MIEHRRYHYWLKLFLQIMQLINTFKIACYN